MKKIALLFILSVLLISPAIAGTHGRNGKVGIGQAINDQKFEKNSTHAILGLTGVFRFWSFYDALIDRQGGVWHDRI